MKSNYEAKNNEIIIKTKSPLNPLERNAWRNIGLMLNTGIKFSQTNYDGYILQFRNIKIKSPKLTEDKIYKVVFKQDLLFKGEYYKILCKDAPSISNIDQDYFISTDIWSPLISLINLEEENIELNRDRYGLVIGETAHRANKDSNNLMVDYFYEASRFLSKVLNINLNSIKYDAPYTIALTFDVDGFSPDQPKKVIEFLSHFPINQPTFMVMSTSKEEGTIYDPLYNLDDPSLRVLWENDVEIGLHSSYIAHDNPELLRKQKERIEKIIGRQIYGHRSHFFRFGFPRSWSHQMRTGFLYDASLGYPDLPGLRNGSNFPIFFPDPDGYENKIWTFATTFLDQHFFNKNSIYNWDSLGKENIDNLLDNLKEKGGMITLDWHVHCIDNDLFPNHFQILKYILDRASRDNAYITGLGNIVQIQNKKWINLLEDEFKWKLRRKKEKIIIKNDELKSYTTTFSKENLGATSIDTAAMSFLSILPEDAEKILDIGSGPGLMSNKIPPFYKVLCMDLDNNILKNVNKPKLIGDITDIPLEEKSVDLVMTCDVLEHLDDKQLDKAIEELMRVTKKYIYIQTPLSETLEEGMVICNTCSHQWHVNYHKQSFTVNRILNLLPKEWTAKVINLTGEISMVKSPKEYYQLLEQFNMPRNSASGINCPKCEQEVQFNFEYHPDDIIKKISNDGEKLYFPYYSEVGILFELNGKLSIEYKPPLIKTRSGLVKPIPKENIMYDNNINFKLPFYEANSLSTFSRLPTVIPNQLALVKTMDGIDLITSSLAENPSVLVYYPKRIQKGDILNIQGNVSSKTKITLLGYTYSNFEVVIGEYELEGYFNIEIPTPTELTNTFGVFRLTWNGSNIISLSNMVLSTQQKPNIFYVYNFPNISEFSHIETIVQGMKFRFSLPYNGISFFSEQPDKIAEKLLSIGYNETPKTNNLLKKHLNYIHNHSLKLEKIIWQQNKKLNLLTKDGNLRKIVDDEKLEEAISTIELLEDQFISTNIDTVDRERILLEKNKENKSRLEKAIQAINFLEEKLVKTELDKDILKTDMLELNERLENALICISLLEQKIVENKKVNGKFNRPKIFILKVIKKMMRKIIIQFKKFPILIAIGDLFGLRKLYRKLKLRGWV